MFVQPHIARMAPYALAKVTVPDGQAPISLSQNESLRSPSPMVIEAAANSLGTSHIYPDPDWAALREALAQLHNLDANNILCGNGSLDLIGCIARAFSGPQRSVLAPAHAYPFFRAASQMADARFDTAPEHDLTVDVDALIEAQRSDTGVVFVANPGNPTGTHISKSDLLRLRRGLRPDVLLVIDEAYGEFADHLDERCFDMISGGNTAILRTFSKAYGMAGFRVGWGVFPTAIASELRKVMNPNNVPAVSQSAAVAAIHDQQYMQETCRLTRKMSHWLASELETDGFKIYPSYTNFLLIDLKHETAAESADNALCGGGIFLRRQTGADLPQTLRITIGDQRNTQIALSALRRWRQEYGI